MEGIEPQNDFQDKLSSIARSSVYELQLFMNLLGRLSKEFIIHEVLRAALLVHFHSSFLINVDEIHGITFSGKYQSSERTESETEAAAPKGDKDQGEVDSSRVTSGVSIPVSTQGQAGSDPEKAHEALAGPDPEPMQEDQTGSDSGKAHVSLAGPNPEHMDDEFLATAYPKVHENLKLITDERAIEDNPESHSGSMSSMKNLDDTDNFGDQFLYDKPTEDDQEKSKVIEESDSTIPDPSHQTVTSTPPVIAPFTDVSSTKPSSLVTPPPINTEATTITYLSLKSSIHRPSAQVQVCGARDGSKFNREILCSACPEPIINQEIKKSPKLDYQESKGTRNPANYHLYHALMEALIADEDAIDKEVKDRAKNHKRKHDSDDDEDDDDDEGPSAGSNQGKSSKRRRHGSGLLGHSTSTKDESKVQRNHGSLMHLLPNNIQLLPQLDGR
ncbi:hypothetical protein Tco_1501740 [Tanacetum coccineum]